MTLAGGTSLTLAGEDSFFTTPPDGKAVLAPDKDDDGGLPRTRPRRLGLTLNVCIFLFFGLGFVEDGIAGSPSVFGRFGAGVEFASLSGNGRLDDDDGASAGVMVLDEDKLGWRTDDTLD